MAREPKSAYTPKLVADYLKTQVTTRGGGGIKAAFGNQFFDHFETEEVAIMKDAFSKELEKRAEMEIEDLKQKIHNLTGKKVELK